MRKNYLNYPVEFVQNVFGESNQLSEVLKSTAGRDCPKLLIVADANVVQRTENLGVNIGRYMREHSLELATTPIVLPGGEKIKSDNLQSVLKVVSAGIDSGLGSGDIVLAIGGGSVIDVASYAAAQIRGGVGVVRIPTTPAAMMCAAFADNAAVDFLGVKDALKLRSVPAAVVIDTVFAKTVLDGVWRSGIAEAVRLSIAHDCKFLSKTISPLAETYARRDMEALDKIVNETITLRGKKGDTDYAEWIAARMESMSGYKLPHGYAISIGILIQLGYAVEIGEADEKLLKSVTEILLKSGALDGLCHSRYLLQRKEELLAGVRKPDVLGKVIDDINSLRI